MFKVKLSKDRKKGDKIVSDSQEKAYWRVHRPPPGYSSSLEPLPLRGGASTCVKRQRNTHDIKKEVSHVTYILRTGIMWKRRKFIINQS